MSEQGLERGALQTGAILLAVLVAACGGSQHSQRNEGAGVAGPKVLPDGGVNDGARCEHRGRFDREAQETAGPGAVLPNVRRVYQLIGTGESMHKILICREVDTNLDGLKDVVRFYNEKGESQREEADTNHDGRIDTWIVFSSGRIAREELDTDFDNNPDIWKYYVGGQLSRIQRDTNRDGKADRWEFYRSGKLERIGLDLDADGHVDRWDHDQAVKLAEESGESAQSQGAKSTSGAQLKTSGQDGGVPPTTGAKR